VTSYAETLPMILDEVEVASVERLSPSFVRIELGGDVLADFGVDGPVLDQRFKLIFPNAAGRLPSFADADESWWESWLKLPEDERGHMRTYTIRAVRGQGVDTRVVVDIVLHPHGGEAGPGADWAAQAQPGQRLVTILPRRGHAYGGIEFAPGDARELLLVADETAAPAVCSILEDLEDDARGTVFVEVPESGDADVLRTVLAPPQVRVHWLPRDGAPLGSRLDAHVRRHLGLVEHDDLADVSDDEVDPDLWETPIYSSSGEDVETAKAVAAVEGLEVASAGPDLDGCYAWIAGESKVVTGLRRLLVKEMGMDRRQVAFMGYWRQGVAMRS
jgi:NADPH-dependent ferric siderophore reductase